MFVGRGLVRGVGSGLLHGTNRWWLQSVDNNGFVGKSKIEHFELQMIIAGRCSESGIRAFCEGDWWLGQGHEVSRSKGYFCIK